MESRRGTYALVLRCRSRATAAVGRLGRLELEAGYYIYVGSAFGAGGVRARVSRHFRTEKRKHWHIDYLREFTSPIGVWYCYADRRLEHAWARWLADLDGISSVENFGCSDCRCRSHLFFTSSRFALAAISEIGGREMKWMPISENQPTEGKPASAMASSEASCSRSSRLPSK